MEVKQLDGCTTLLPLCCIASVLTQVARYLTTCMIYSFSLHRKFQKPFSLSQLNLSTSRNYSEEEIYRHLNSICEILEYINTLNGLHTNYEHKYNGSRLTEVAALIAAGAQVQKDVCS